MTNASKKTTKLYWGEKKESENPILHHKKKKMLTQVVLGISRKDLSTGSPHNRHQIQKGAKSPKNHQKKQKLDPSCVGEYYQNQQDQKKRKQHHSSKSKKAKQEPSGNRLRKHERNQLSSRPKKNQHGNQENHFFKLRRKTRASPKAEKLDLGSSKKITSTERRETNNQS